MRKHNAEVTADRIREQWHQGNCRNAIDNLLAYDKEFSAYMVALIVRDMPDHDKERFVWFLGNILD